MMSFLVYLPNLVQQHLALLQRLQLCGHLDTAVLHALARALLQLVQLGVGFLRVHVAQ